MAWSAFTECEFGLLHVIEAEVRLQLDQTTYKVPASTGRPPTSQAELRVGGRFAGGVCFPCEKKERTGHWHMFHVNGVMSVT